MIHLSNDQLMRLKDTRITFSDPNDITSKAWIDEGILKIPSSKVFVEDYASFFIRSEFYSIGSFSYSWSPFTESVTIGRYCSIADQVEIIPDSHATHLFTTSPMTHDMNFASRKLYYQDNGYSASDALRTAIHPNNNKIIEIGNDVYIGRGAKLRKGIKIGHGAIIGAYSVVTRDVPPYSVVAGNPAGVVRMRYDDKQIEKLLELEWWNWDFKEILNKTIPDSIDSFIYRVQCLIAESKIKSFKPKSHNIKDLIEKTVDE